MPHSLSELSAGVVLRPGQPPVVQASAGADPSEWAAGHRDALRAVVAEHGCVMVRGLGLRDATTTDGVSRATGAQPDDGKGGLRAAPPLPGWPLLRIQMAREPADVHAPRASYALEFPGLMMFACLTAPASGGATGIADAAAVLDALPAGLVTRLNKRAGCSPATTTKMSGHR